MTTQRDGSEPRRLESLLDLAEPMADWSDADLAAMLRHQLAQPLPRAAETTAPTAPPTTIRALLEQPHPSIESLRSLKRLAKVRRAQADAAVPEDLWRVIYYASIAAAVRAGDSISDLSPAELSQGFQWTLARPWLDAAVRPLVEQAERQLAHAPR